MENNLGDIDTLEDGIAFERSKSILRSVDIMTDNDDEMVQGKETVLASEELGWRSVTEEIAKLKRRQRPGRSHLPRSTDMSGMMHELTLGSEDEEEELP